MPARGSNKNRAVRIGKLGAVHLDVSTKAFPSAMTKLDAVDFMRLCDDDRQGRWFAKKGTAGGGLYVFRWIRLKSGRRYMQSMHRAVLGLKPGDPIKADHKNGDGLDNRRCNLRRATHSQNCANARSACTSTSKYRGVSWDAERGKWTASIANRQKANGRKCLGRFDKEREAARAYDAAAIKVHGRFARLNFPKRHRP